MAASLSGRVRAQQRLIHIRWPEFCSRVPTHSHSGSVPLSSGKHPLPLVLSSGEHDRTPDVTSRLHVTPPGQAQCHQPGQVGDPFLGAGEERFLEGVQDQARGPAATGLTTANPASEPTSWSRLAACSPRGPRCTSSPQFRSVRSVTSAGLRAAAYPPRLPCAYGFDTGQRDRNGVHGRLEPRRQRPGQSHRGRMGLWKLPRLRHRRRHNRTYCQQHIDAVWG
jgi:hypothetical protein